MARERTVSRIRIITIRLLRGGPRVRILLPPPASRLRTGLPPIHGNPTDGRGLPQLCPPKRLQELATSAITGDRGFESGSLQRGVKCEPDFLRRECAPAIPCSPLATSGFIQPGVGEHA